MKNKRQKKKNLLFSSPGPQYTTSYTVAFLSPEPVTMYLSSGETSQLSTDDDSLDCERGEEGGRWTKTDTKKDMLEKIWLNI